MKIGYLGPKGTFTKMAVDGLFASGEKVGFETIPQCMDAVAAGDVEYGVVPIENAIEGTVHLTMDYLIHQVELPIAGEIVVPIRQHLLVKHDALSLDEITTVYSHSHAIAQCHQYLHQQLPQAKTTFTSSTGSAAELVARLEEPVAAIGNELAAKEFGLKIKQPDIHDYGNNHTRFIILAKEPQELSLPEKTITKHKTTLYVTLPSDYSGALHQVLSAFAWRKLNLSKIESRPMKTGLGNYFFIIDVETAYDNVLFAGVQEELTALGSKVTILGSYPTYKYENM